MAKFWGRGEGSYNKFKIHFLPKFHLRIILGNVRFLLRQLYRGKRTWHYRCYCSPPPPTLPTPELYWALFLYHIKASKLGNIFVKNIEWTCTDNALNDVIWPIIRKWSLLGIKRGNMSRNKRGPDTWGC